MTATTATAEMTRPHTSQGYETRGSALSASALSVGMRAWMRGSSMHSVDSSDVENTMDDASERQQQSAAEAQGGFAAAASAELHQRPMTASPRLGTGSLRASAPLSEQQPQPHRTLLEGVRIESFVASVVASASATDMRVMTATTATAL